MWFQIQFYPNSKHTTVKYFLLFSFWSFSMLCSWRRILWENNNIGKNQHENQGWVSQKHKVGTQSPQLNGSISITLNTLPSKTVIYFLFLCFCYPLNSILVMSSVMSKCLWGVCRFETKHINSLVGNLAIGNCWNTKNVEITKIIHAQSTGINNSINNFLKTFCVLHPAFTFSPFICQSKYKKASHFCNTITLSFSSVYQLASTKNFYNPK